MTRSFYSDTISTFNNTPAEHILGVLTLSNEFTLEITQREAWIQQIEILKAALQTHEGKIFFEYSIPRMGRRIDVVLLIKNVIFVLEFKVGEKEFLLGAQDQVMDYSLDLKNFHETSHHHLIAPVLIATEAKNVFPIVSTTPHNDRLLFVIKTNAALLQEVINDVLRFADGDNIAIDHWETGRYAPTPTII